MSANKPLTPPGLPQKGQKVRIRAHGKWKDVNAQDSAKKVGFIWVKYIDDDNLETWQILSSSQ